MARRSSTHRRPRPLRRMAPFTVDVGPARPVAHAAPLRGDPIRIDGVADDTAWSRATAVSWTTDYRGAATAASTRARFLWSDAALYALFEVDGTGLDVDTTRPTNVERPRLYEEDCVELFLVPKGIPTRRSGDEIQARGPRGHFFDAQDRRRFARDAAHAADVGWSSGVDVKTTVDEGAHRAIIEAKIPAADVIAALKPGAGATARAAFEWRDHPASGSSSHGARPAPTSRTFTCSRPSASSSSTAERRSLGLRSTLQPPSRERRPWARPRRSRARRWQAPGTRREDPSPRRTTQHP